MPLPQTPPGGQKEPNIRYIHFGYTRTPASTSWHAYTAGPVHWFTCHTSGRCKPCLHVMTSGELVCDLCASPVPPQIIGYLPLYREVDAKPVMVIVHESVTDQVTGLRLHTRVVIGREAEKTDGVWVQRALKEEPRYVTTLRERMRPVDLTPTLLKVWKIPALTDWYKRTHGQNDRAVSLPDPSAETAAAGAIDGQGEQLPDAKPERDRSNRDWVQRQRAKLAEGFTVPNGKHKPE